MNSEIKALLRKLVMVVPMVAPWSILITHIKLIFQSKVRSGLEVAIFG